MTHRCTNPSWGLVIQNTFPFSRFPLRGCFSIAAPQSDDRVITVHIASTPVSCQTGILGQNADGVHLTLRLTQLELQDDSITLLRYSGVFTSNPLH